MRETPHLEMSEEMIWLYGDATPLGGVEKVQLSEIITMRMVPTASDT
jgi:hypothetical protein